MIEISLRSVLINNSAVAKHTLDWEETYYLSEVTSGEIIMYHLQTKSGESDGPLTPYSIMAPIIILSCFIQWGLCCLIEGKMNKNKNKKYENGDHFGIRCIKINGFWLWRTLFFGSIQNGIMVLHYLHHVSSILWCISTDYKWNIRHTLHSTSNHNVLKKKKHLISASPFSLNKISLYIPTKKKSNTELQYPCQTWPLIKHDNYCWKKRTTFKKR